jgi:hypothetical protein
MLHRIVGATALAAALCGTARAQDMEPRSYSPSPVGLNFAGLIYGYSSGSVVFDPTLPITDVTAHVHGFAAVYGRTLDVFGRQGLATLALPFATMDGEGQVFEQTRRVTRTGPADLKARFSVNLYGNPAQTLREFAQSAHDSVLVGASLTLSAPTGQYFGDKLVNLGTNRWAFKPEIGVAVPWRKFSFELYAGVVFFTANTDFYPGGQRRQQDPLGTFQLHGSYTFRPGLWVALDGTWYGGGAASVNGGPKSERLRNSRVGTTVSLPLSRAQSLKFSFSRGAIVRLGENFTTIAAAWQVRWF